MKLRNKKTGEIINSKEVLTDKFIVDIFSKNFNYFKLKLDKIQEDWEVVQHEPLIKDENIRNAVRAWAEANEVDEVIMAHSLEYDEYLLYTNYGAKIKFNKNLDIKGGSYTIAELCGRKNERNKF